MFLWDRAIGICHLLELWRSDERRPLTNKVMFVFFFLGGIKVGNDNE